MSLITLTEAKVIIGTTSATDGEIQPYIDALQPVIEDITGPLVAASVTQTFNGGQAAVVLWSEASAITSVTENGVALASTDYTPNLSAGIVSGGGQLTPRNFLPGNQNIIVVYTVGSATIPANAVLAARELFRDWWQLGKQGTRPPFGDPAEGEVQVSGEWLPSPRVLSLLNADERPPGV